MKKNSFEHFVITRIRVNDLLLTLDGRLCSGISSSVATDKFQNKVELFSK